VPPQSYGYVSPQQQQQMMRPQAPPYGYSPYSGNFFQQAPPE